MFMPYSAESNVMNVLYNLKDDLYEIDKLLGNDLESLKFIKKANELRDDLPRWLKKNKSKHFEGVKARKLV